MSSKRLTVAVPTYNRNQMLLRTLSRVLGQLGQESKLLVLDNCSDVPVAETLGDMLRQFAGADVTIVRNKANIGASANVMRCFELCDTEYVWVLGDDDLLREDALATVFKHIEAHPAALYFNFSTPAYERPGMVIGHGAAEFARSMDSLGNIMFTSAGLFKAGPMSSGLAMGYQFAYSLAPHLALLLRGLGADGEFVLASESTLEDHCLISSTRRSTWSASLCYAAVPVLVELPLPNDVRRELRLRLRHRVRLRYLAKILAASAIQQNDSEYAAYVFDQQWTRLFYGEKRPLQYLAYAFYRLTIKHGWLRTLVFGRNLLKRISEVDDLEVQ